MSRKKDIIESVSSDLELDENISIQEKGWVIQRVGWVLMILFLILAIAGAFGNGLISKQTIERSGQKIEFQQFFRYEARMEVKLEVESGLHGTKVSFPNDYLKNFRIESILPEPKENKSEQDRIIYQFDGSGPMNIIFYLIPQSYGSIGGIVQVNDQQFNLHHFIYP